jgi:predicted TIM-barrel fold metal-dependent hydrolase
MLYRSRSRRASFVALGVLALANACTAAAGNPYTAADFTRVRKFDAHVHANTDSTAFLDEARKDNFELLSINVDYPDFPSLAEQARVAHALLAVDPWRFHFATTFAMAGWTQPGWAGTVNAGLARAVADGALAVKIWKNVGMVERDAAGKLLSIDDPVFDPVIAQIEALGVPLIAHQGEPHNCWLPLAEMTTDNDRTYFAEHPQYHMYLHPEQPSYEALMAARDRFLAAHPDLSFVGAHLASLEWDVDLLARFLDEFPNAVVDMAARMTQLQYQSVRDRGRVRAFLIRYQDRILYGSDLEDEASTPRGEFRREVRDFWLSDWRYLATGDTQRIDAIRSLVRGLALPRSVIRKIYYRNSRRVFLGHPSLTPGADRS